MLAPGTGIQGGPQEADCRQYQLVDRDRRTFGGCLMQGVCDEPGGERQERHHQQNEQVDLQDDRI